VSNRGAITRKVDTSPWKRAPVDFIVSSDHTEFITTPNNGDSQQRPKKLSFRPRTENSSPIRHQK
jgi:hypothetical protein